jgi:hypothetical protein
MNRELRAEGNMLGLNRQTQRHQHETAKPHAQLD